MILALTYSLLRLGPITKGMTVYLVSLLIALIQDMAIIYLLIRS